MYSEIDLKLLDALRDIPPNYAEAEKLIAAGADVNAFSDNRSLLCEAIEFRKAKTASELATFFIAHGFNGQFHDGRPLLSALEVFAYGADDGYGFDDPELVELFKTLLKLNPAVVTLPSENEYLLEDFFLLKAQLYEEEGFVPESTFLCLLLAEITRRVKDGQDFSSLYGWNAASGRCLTDIRVNPKRPRDVQIVFDEVTLTVGADALWAESNKADCVCGASVKSLEQFSDLIGRTVTGIGLPMAGLTQESPFQLMLRLDGHDSILLTPDYDRRMLISRHDGVIKAMTWTDKQLADALVCDPPDFAAAEEQLRRGANLNAVDANGQDHEGVLSRVLSNCSAHHMERILEWFEEHGLLPDTFGGEHILSALYALPGARPEEISALTRLLDMAGSMSIPINYGAAEEPLLDQMIHGAQCLEGAACDAEAAAVCRIQAEVVRRFESGLPYRYIQGWDKAPGLIVDAVKLLVPDQEAASPVFYDIDAGRGKERCHRGELALYAGDRVLVILNGRHPMVCRTGDELVDGKTAFDNDSAFQSLLGQEIRSVEVLGPDWEKPVVTTVSICFTGETRLSSGFIVERSAGKVRLHPTATLLTAQ